MSERSRAMEAVCRAAGWPYCAEHDRPLHHGGSPCSWMHEPPEPQHHYLCEHPYRECECYRFGHVPPGGIDLCGDEEPETIADAHSWRCTRTKGHEGEHMATTVGPSWPPEPSHFAAADNELRGSAVVQPTAASAEVES